MKLNNKGWGLTKLIVYISFFSFVLLLIVFLTYKADRVDHINLVEEEYIFNIN